MSARVYNYLRPSYVGLLTQYTDVTRSCLRISRKRGDVICDLVLRVCFCEGVMSFFSPPHRVFTRYLFQYSRYSSRSLNVVTPLCTTATARHRPPPPSPSNPNSEPPAPANVAHLCAPPPPLLPPALACCRPALLSDGRTVEQVVL